MGNKDDDCNIAIAILEPYFEASRAIYLEFSERKNLNTRGIKKLKMECRADMHDTPRHFAGAATDGTSIAFAPLENSSIKTPGARYSGILGLHQ